LQTPKKGAVREREKPRSRGRRGEEKKPPLVEVRDEDVKLELGKKKKTATRPENQEELSLSQGC